MAGTPTREFLTKLEARRDGIKATAECLLLEARSAGREQLSEGELFRYKQMISDLRGVESHIQEYRSDLARVGTLPAIGGGMANRAISSAGRLAPLYFGDAELRRFQSAAMRGENCEISADPTFGGRMEQRFTSADSLLPPDLYPAPIEAVHEWRVLDKLPGYSFDRPSVEFIRHTSTTGAAGSVAEGALKPEVTLNVDHLTAAAVKLAATLTLSREIIDDWDQFHQYATAELYKLVIDVENGEILAGDGTGTDMTGFYQTPGILQHNCAADTGTNETTLDSVEKAIAQLRSGSALAEPTLAIFNPEDWSAMRRIKDLYGRFILAPDPSEDEVNTLWGIDVLVTVQNPQGQGLLIDTRKFGQVAIRSPLSMFLGYSGQDFQQNLIRFIAEERLVLTVTRPAAVLELINLPTPTTALAESGGKSSKSSG